MPPLQQSLTISLLRVALWWQKWQSTGDFNTFHVIFGAEMQFFSSFSFRLRCLLAPVKVPPRSFEGAFSLSAPWGGTISSMGWSNPLHPMEQQEKRHFSQVVIFDLRSNYLSRLNKENASIFVFAVSKFGSLMRNTYLCK